MKIIEKEIPDNALIKTAMDRIDFYDNYTMVLPKEQAPDLVKMPRLYFYTMPKWFQFLMYLRETLAKLVGFKTAHGMDVKGQLKNFKGEIGEKIAVFNVMGRTTEEIMLGEDDKHLNFRCSFLRLDRGKNVEINLITTVKYTSWMGNAYFFFVKPIHRIISPLLLRNLASETN